VGFFLNTVYIFIKIISGASEECGHLLEVTLGYFFTADHSMSCTHTRLDSTQ